jgi:hypothetical protein
VDIQVDSTGAIAGMPVWVDVDVADEHAGFRSHPAGGPIPPTYRIDPREVHHALALFELRTADPVLWRSRWTVSVTVVAGLCCSATVLKDRVVIRVMEPILLYAAVGALGTPPLKARAPAAPVVRPP